MIVNQIKTGWEIIHHQAHGLLAAKIAMQFPESDFPKGYRAETIAAILCHDDHQDDYEHNNYVTDIGAPRDFTLAKSTKTQKYKRTKRVICAAYEKSRWTGMLVTYHFNFLYKGAEGLGKRLKKYLKEERKISNKLLKEMSLKPSALEDTYQIMRFCDRCSLILTRDNIPEMGRKVEIITMHDNVKHELKKDKKENILVKPWCFAENKFEATVEVQLLTKLEFKDDQELEKSLKNANVERRIFHFKKS
jgi:hypothetical protein